MKQLANRVIKGDNILFILFSLWCLVDSFNGYMINNGLFPVSQLYKSLVALLVIIRFRNNEKIMRPFIILSILLFISIFHSALIGEPFQDSITLMAKLFTNILFFMYFCEVCRIDSDYFETKSSLVLKWNFLFLVANIILGILGFGYHSYGGEGAHGSHGFIYSSNEMSGALAVVLPWAMYSIKMKHSFKFYVCFSAIILFITYAMSTKAGIAAAVVSFILITLFYGVKKERLICLLTLPIIIYYVINNIQSLLDSELPIMQYFNFFLERDGIVGALSSGRLDYWAEESRDFYNADLLSKLIGMGGGRTVEMDIQDTLLNCGLIGTFLLIVTYIKMLRNPFKLKYRLFHFNKVIFTSNFILIFISITAGHVLFSSMAGMLIAVSNAKLFGWKNGKLMTCNGNDGLNIIASNHKYISQ